MPTYEYRCEANGRVLEVRHNMAERLSSWGELCERAGVAPGCGNGFCGMGACGFGE
ncbi:MAG: hypothetical protein ACREV7_17690 [Steroidobacteraceae bacterium]